MTHRRVTTLARSFAWYLDVHIEVADATGHRDLVTDVAPPWDADAATADDFCQSHFGFLPLTSSRLDLPEHGIRGVVFFSRASGRVGDRPGDLVYCRGMLLSDALAESRTPFSVLTKGTLVRRDLPALTAARSRVGVHLAMSIAVMDDDLQQRIEPGTPRAAARLETVRAATEAGLAVQVFLCPVLPHLTDSTSALDDALALIREAGARSVVYGALHLRPGAKEWYFAWLAREHPDLVPLYRGLYPGVSSVAPMGYRRALAARIRPLLRRHRLDAREDEEPPRRMRPGPGRSPPCGRRARRAPPRPPAETLF